MISTIISRFVTDAARKIFPEKHKEEGRRPGIRYKEFGRDFGRMIMLIDEIDALAKHRSESYETTARLVSILLSEMDGLVESNQILLVGSANNLETVDRAVLDRFDLEIEFPLPDRDQLQAAVAYYAMQAQVRLEPQPKCARSKRHATYANEITW